MTSSTTQHGLRDGEEYALKIGTSFQPQKAKDSYHLLRYDFKPASVDTSREAEVHIGSNHECTVTIPNVHDAGATTYKGGRRPCQKECILIIDKDTGEITLERISSNIQLKKSRVERSSEINAAKRAEMKNSVVDKNNQATKVKTKPNQNNPAAVGNHTSIYPNTTVSTSQLKQSTTPTPPVPQPQTIKKRENVLSMSTSDSNSSSSESSDSDSGPENDVQPKNENALVRKSHEQPLNNATHQMSKSHEQPLNSTTYQMTKLHEQPLNNSTHQMTKSHEQPLNNASHQIKKSTPNAAQSNGNNNRFMSTLHHDLHLSDSNESDSD